MAPTALCYNIDTASEVANTVREGKKAGALKCVFSEFSLNLFLFGDKLWKKAGHKFHKNRLLSASAIRSYLLQFWFGSWHSLFVFVCEPLSTLFYCTLLQKNKNTTKIAPYQKKYKESSLPQWLVWRVHLLSLNFYWMLWGAQKGKSAFCSIISE